MKERICIADLVAEIKSNEFYIRAWRRYDRESQRRMSLGSEGLPELERPPKVGKYLRYDPAYATILYTLRSQARTNPRVHRHDGDLESQAEFLEKNRSRWEHLIEKPETIAVEAAA